VKSGRSTNNYTDLAQRSGFVSSVNHRKFPSSVSTQACSTERSASRSPARYIHLSQSIMTHIFPNPHAKRKRHQAFYRRRDRRVNNHENRKQDISARQTKSENDRMIKKKTMYPDAPSPALLRVPLSLGTFFIDLMVRKCSQIPAGPAMML